jgi:hypothetical protein
VRVADIDAIVPMTRDAAAEAVIDRDVTVRVADIDTVVMARNGLGMRVIDSYTVMGIVDVDAITRCAATADHHAQRQGRDEAFGRRKGKV